MTDQAPELLPCPFCGDDKIMIKPRSCTGVPSYYQAECDECGATSHGSFHLDKIGAAKEWNTRPTPAERPVGVRIVAHEDCLNCRCGNHELCAGTEPRVESVITIDRNEAIAEALSRPVPQVRELLREARQYVSDAGNDEDAETQRNSQALLDEIDAALTAGRHVSQGVRTTAEIEQILFSHFYTGEPGEHEAIKAAAAALASDRPSDPGATFTDEEWHDALMGSPKARPSDAAVAKPLPGELALIQIAMETLRHIANYTPVSRIQPVMIARDALKKIDALTFESEPVKALALPPDEPARVTPSTVGGEATTALIGKLRARAINLRQRDVNAVGEDNVGPIQGFFDWQVAAELERLSSPTIASEKDHGK